MPLLVAEGAFQIVANGPQSIFAPARKGGVEYGGASREEEIFLDDLPTWVVEAKWNAVKGERSLRGEPGWFTPDDYGTPLLDPDGGYKSAIVNL